MENLVNRPEYLDWLIKFKDKDLVKVVSGIRRCGKSTLFELYINWLLQNGVNQDQIFHYNFENPANRNLLEPYAFYDFLNPKLSKEKKNYIFLDEVQNLKEFEKTVDGFYINHNNDVYITGSNAYFLSGELATFLSGRYVETKMQPFSFAEFVSATENSKYLLDKYQEYLQKSSFPYALRLESQSELLSYLDGVFNTVLVKDILPRTTVSDIALIKDIIRFVFDVIGSPLSASNIAKSLTSSGRKTNYHTVDNCLEAMVDSFLCYKVQRYDVKGKNLLATQPKYYVADIGLRNFLLGTKSQDRGHILENIVYLELLRRGGQVYVGKSGDMEIDFIVIKSGIETYYQVAYTVMDDATLERELKPLRSLNNHYEKYLLTLDYDLVTNHDGIKQVNVLNWLLKKPAKN